MKQNGIGADVAHVSNLRYSVFEEFNKDKLLGLQQFDEQLINIPCGWWLSQDDLEHIVKTANTYGG